MQLLSNLVSALAWPAAVVVFAVVFRRSIATKLAQLTNLKAGGVEAGFAARAADAEDEAEVATESIRAELTATADGDPIWDKALDLVSVSPRTAVLESFLRVEESLRQLAKPEGTRQSAVQMARVLGKSGTISQPLVSSITELALLRNQAVHMTDFTFNEDGARSYVQAARRISTALDALPEPDSENLG
jgi:hypothetical protein